MKNLTWKIIILAVAVILAVDLGIMMNIEYNSSEGQAAAAENECTDLSAGE